MEYEQSLLMMGKEGGNAFVNSKLATLFGLVVAASLIVGFLQWRESKQLASENAQLRSAADAAQTAESPTIAKEVDAEKDGAAAEKLELLKLRNEVRQLRENTKELEKLRAELATARAETSRLRTAQTSNAATPTNAPGFVGKEGWRFAGYSSPETTVQSLLYSMASGDYDAFIAGVAPADRETFLKEGDLTREKFTAESTQGSDKIAGYRILGREASSTDEKVVLSVEVLEVNGKSKPQSMVFIRDGQEWRMTHRK